jgi:hypothetical protein
MLNTSHQNQDGLTLTHCAHQLEDPICVSNPTTTSSQQNESTRLNQGALHALAWFEFN